MLCDMLYDAADPTLCIIDVLWGCMSTRSAYLDCFYLRVPVAVISAHHFAAQTISYCDVALRKCVLVRVSTVQSTMSPTALAM